MQDGVAQRAGQLVEHRRLLEEGELLAVERAEQLVAHVVGEQPVVAAEARDGAVDVLVAAQREGGEIEPGRPALGALEQHEHVLGLEVEPARRSIATASRRVMTRSRARRSNSRPCARRRPIGRSGSRRPAATTCEP